MQRQQQNNKSPLFKAFSVVTPLSKAIAMIIFILLPFSGFYLGTRYQKRITTEIYTNFNNVQTSKETVTNQNVSTKDILMLYPTEKNLLLVVNSESPFSILMPNQWNVEHNENYSSFKLFNERYSLFISMGSLGSLLCLYPGDQGFGSYDPKSAFPFQYPEFNNFTEVLTPSVKYRRGSSQYDLNDTSKVKNELIVETVCEFNNNSNSYSNTASIGGSIRYEYPNDFDQERLNEMDDILSSITLIEKRK